MTRYVFKLGRVTSHEPENPHSTEPDNPDTEVITIAAPAPVFVDSTGRRSRRLRRLAYAFGALVMTYGGLISVSLAGGPVRSSAVLPLPGLEPETEGEQVPPRPGPTPVPSASPSPSQAAAAARYITEAMPRRTFVVRPPAQRVASTKVPPRPPAAKPSPSATPKPSASTKPTESTTTKPATKPPTKPVTVPPTAPKPTGTVPPIVGPVPPAAGTGGGTGGQGGGSVLGPVDEPSAHATASAKPASTATAKPVSTASAKPVSTEEDSDKPAEAVLINATPSVELADLTEQIEADPEPTVADTPADEDDA
jgi:hypothetical protein